MGYVRYDRYVFLTLNFILVVNLHFERNLSSLNGEHSHSWLLDLIRTVLNRTHMMGYVRYDRHVFLTLNFILVVNLHFDKKFIESKRRTLSFLALSPNTLSFESHPRDGVCQI